MGLLADKLDTMTITVSSPDSMIRARVTAGRPEALGFRPGAYESYGTAGLEHQLARTAGLCFVSHQRGVAQLMERFNISFPMDPRQAVNIAQRNYLTEVAELTVIDPSDESWVRFAVNGISNWHCRIAPTALDELSEDDFVAETLDAASALVQLLNQAKARLKTHHLGNRGARPRHERH